MRSACIYLGFLAALVGLAAGLAGCESGDGSSDLNQPAEVSRLTISPARVKLAPTDSVAVFTASGGTPPYRWSLSDSSLGSLPDTRAHTITYTPTADSLGANVLQVVDQNNWVGEAIINQIPGTNAP